MVASCVIGLLVHLLLVPPTLVAFDALQSFTKAVYDRSDKQRLIDISNSNFVVIVIGWPSPPCTTHTGDPRCPAVIDSSHNQQLIQWGNEGVSDAGTGRVLDRDKMPAELNSHL